jgi:hydrophobe/amphiphile efflux-3 (HAE3) family protein
MISAMFGGIARTINRRPLAVAAMVVAIFGLAIVGMTLITMQTGWETYIDKNSQTGVTYSEYSDNFKSDSIILIIEASDPLDHDILSYIDGLEAAVRQQQNIEGTNSVVEVLKSANGGTIPSSRGEVDTIIGSLPPDIRSLVVPSNMLTLVQIQLDQGMSDTAQQSTLNNVISIVDHTEKPPGVKVEISGSPAFSQQMREGLMQNMAILIGGAMILMVIVMGILFSYVRYRFMPVLMVGIGLATSLGLMGLAGIPLNMAVIGAFPVLIGLGIDYAIQFHARFDEEARKGSLEDAVFTTVTRTGPAVMYAMLATCMGFIAMFISDVPMIRSFGLVAIIGIFTSFWVSCLGVPTLGLLLKYRPKGQATGQCYAVGTEACDSTADQPVIRPRTKGKKPSFSYGQFLTNVSVKIAKNPVPVLILVGVIAVVGFSVDPLIAVQTNENAFVPSDMPAKINIDKVTRIMGATSTADFYVRGYSQDLDTVKWIAGFQDYELSRHPELTKATSIVSYILTYHGGTMPETQAELDSVLQSIPDSIRNEYTSGSMNSVIKFNTVDLEMTEQNSLKQQMVDDIAFLKPPAGITVTPTGNFELYTQMLSSLVDSKTMMTYLGFLLVFIFLVVVYRHLHAITPMIPIVLIVGWNAAAMFVLDIPYTPLTATLGSMAIGVAAEYTILVMERYAEEKERLHDTVPAIQESVKRIGTAITVSGLATFFGFSALCLATFPIISNFGVTTLIAVGFSLIGAIFVMPAVLSVVGRREKPAPVVDGNDSRLPPEEGKTI